MHRLRFRHWFVYTLLTVSMIGCGGSGGGGDGDIDPSGAPTVELTSTPPDVSYNESVVLEWSTTNADSCTASGTWSGEKDVNGREEFGPLTSDASFSLSCTGNDTETTDTANVTVGEATDPSTPSVSLTADPTRVAINGSTTLSWSSSNVDNCTASGAWEGDKDTSGEQVIEDIDENSTFTLTCQGSTGGPADDTVNVTVSAVATGTAALRWTPPTKNTDGTDLTDLMGYKIHAGRTSGAYTRIIPVNDNTIDSYVVEDLAAGTWFFAVSAVDTSGNESTLSNEESKVISTP